MKTRSYYTQLQMDLRLLHLNKRLVYDILLDNEAGLANPVGATSKMSSLCVGLFWGEKAVVEVFCAHQEYKNTNTWNRIRLGHSQ